MIQLILLSSFHRDLKTIDYSKFMQIPGIIVIYYRYKEDTMWCYSTDCGIYLWMWIKLFSGVMTSNGLPVEWGWQVSVVEVLRNRCSRTCKWLARSNFNNVEKGVFDGKRCVKWFLGIRGTHCWLLDRPLNDKVHYGRSVCQVQCMCEMYSRFYKKYWIDPLSYFPLGNTIIALSRRQAQIRHFFKAYNPVACLIVCEKSLIYVYIYM